MALLRNLRRTPLCFLALSLFLIAAVSCSRTKPDRLQAQQFENEEKWNQALTAYSQLVSETSPSRTSYLAELQSHMGHCLIELGRGTDALIALEKAVFLDANNSNAHLRMAQLFVIAGVPQRAEEHIAFVGALHPDDPEMLQVRAAMYAAEDHEDLAERDLTRAYQLSRNRERVAEQLTQFYVDENKPDKAIAILTTAARQNPRSSRLRLTLARLYETEGETAAAEAEYREAIALENTAENNQRLAQFLARNGRIIDAEAILRRTDANRSDSTAAADLELQSGHPREALRSYESTYGRLSISTSSDVPAFSTQIAGGALAARMIEADLALASGGDDFGVVAARKHLEQAGGNLDRGTQSLLKAEIDLLSGDLINAERNAADALNQGNTIAAAQYLLGEIAGRRGHQQEAVNRWESAVSANPNYVPARLALATAALRHHDGIKAEQEVVGVVRDEPANMTALLIYARALLLQERYDSARALCRRALAVNPQDAQVPMLLGDIALQQHQLAMALLEYEKAMLLQPHSEQAIEGLTSVYEKGGANEVLLRKLEKLAQNGTPSSRLMEITGRLYAWQHRYSDAARCLRRAAEMDPNRQSASLALAIAYSDKDPNATARDLLSQPEMARLGSSHGKDSSALIAALRAENRGDQAEAVKQYESAIRAGDPSGIASNNLAWLYASEGKQLNYALKLAQHALELNPGSPQVLDTIGMIQFENRQFSQAIASFQNGVRRASELQGMEAVQRTIEAHLTAALQVAGRPAAQ